MPPAQASLMPRALCWAGHGGRQHPGAWILGSALEAAPWAEQCGPKSPPTRSLLLPFPHPAHVSAALVEKDFIYQPLEPDSFLFRFFF